MLKLIISGLDENYGFNTRNFIGHMDRVRPKVVYLVNPNNPTGTEYDLNGINKLVANYPKTMFIVDEAYYEFASGTAQSLVTEYPECCESQGPSQKRLDWHLSGLDIV